MEIRIVDNEDDVRAVRALFQEYWDSFGFTPCFQDFGGELASLPGKYALPGGRLAVAWVEDEPAGCIALRPVDASRCEFKRLYVRPAFRSHRLGKALVEWLIGEARSAGYREMLCDTMPVMEQALAMYERMGFERTGPYVEDATEGAVYLRLKLNGIV
jgi:GNAT superfamily N-acetyltransferase